MTNLWMESIVLAFTMGGIFGALIALHLSHTPNKAHAHDRPDQYHQ